MSGEQRQPTRRHILDLLDTVEVAASDMMRRWHDGIPPEVRDEIATLIYQPILRMLIDCKRRRQSGPPSAP